ncbi:MAG: hypothetical protein K0R28_6323 [Paenibacillus sp.]|jgi:hypothetical protein|nr:hypothetical protein [Paenibacillus sp.]
MKRAAASAARYALKRTLYSVPFLLFCYDKGFGQYPTAIDYYLLKEAGTA